MIQSMTAYARVEHKAPWGTASWELRSVNQRYLEASIRLPEQLRSLEPALRGKLRKRLNRGKIDINLYHHPVGDDGHQLQLDQGLAKQIISAANWVKQQAGHGELNIVKLLRWPGVISNNEQDIDAISQELLQSFDRAIEQLIEARRREGEAIKIMLETRLDNVLEQVGIVKKNMPIVMQWQRDKIKKRLNEIKGEIDPNRIEQELVMLAQKMDVDEEIDRLNTHVIETRRIINKGGAQGRRLDFMMQEFNRESNTLASKSISTDITAAAIELKVLIEQMREQIQNIE